MIIRTDPAFDAIRATASLPGHDSLPAKLLNLAEQFEQGGSLHNALGTASESAQSTLLTAAARLERLDRERREARDG